MHDDQAGLTSSHDLPPGPSPGVTGAAPAGAPGAAKAGVPWQPGDVVLGGYRVGGLIGKGGMGAVWPLRNPTTGASFAVKRSRKLDDAHRRKFLSELLAWADLPPHQNLLPFRFFRTDGDEVFLFSDYAESGSLRDWIRENRLPSVGAILDVAIQFAWGLHVAHEHGTVHQDVKPANALMTPDGRVLVGDFGLARSRAAVEEVGKEEEPASILVSCGGTGTPAFCSPEQARGEPLTRRTDVWSWGLSVLEMFTGGPTWPVKPVAGGQKWVLAPSALEGLEAYLRRTEDDPTLIVMHDWLADVLRRCFRHAPEERWGSLAEAIDAIQSGWRALGGKDDRRLAAVPPLPARVIDHDRRTNAGGAWRDPLLWLREALTYAGRDPEEARGLMPPRGRWRHTQAMADMVALHEADRLFKQRPESDGRARERLAFLCCYDRSFVHESLDDRVGALSLYDRAIDLFGRLVEQEGRAELANDLANACMNKAGILLSLGEGRSALPLYDRAIGVFERLAQREGGALANALANAYVSKALAVGELGDERAALPLYDRAIALGERLVEREGQTDLARGLAGTCTNKANALRSLGEGRAALPLYDRAIGLLDRIVGREWRIDLADDLANACTNKANALRSLGEFRAALPLYDRAIDLFERLVQRDGRAELANDLAHACMSKANALQSMGLPLYDQAIALLERLMEQEGRAELADDLARACLNKADALHAAREGGAALPLYDRAIALLERLVERDWGARLAGDLARAYVNKADVLHAAREGRAALPLYDRAIALLEPFVEREGRAKLAGDLARACVNKADAMCASALYDEGERQGKERDALPLYDRAIALLERLVESEGRSELLGDLARTRLKRIELWLVISPASVDQLPLVRVNVALLRQEIERTSRPDLIGALHWAEKTFTDLS